MTDNSFSSCHQKLKMSIEEAKFRFIYMLKQISMLCNKTASIIGDLNQKLLDISIRSDALYYKIERIYYNFHKEYETKILGFLFKQLYQEIPDKSSSNLPYIRNVYATGDSTNMLQQETKLTNLDIETQLYKANIITSTSMYMQNKVKITVHNILYPIESNSKSVLERNKKLDNAERFIYTQKELHKCLMKAILRGVKLKTVKSNKFINCEYNNLKKNINELINTRIIGKDIIVEDEDQNSLESWDTSS